LPETKAGHTHSFLKKPLFIRKKFDMQTIIAYENHNYNGNFAYFIVAILPL